jgi:hypothetical protein
MPQDFNPFMQSAFELANNGYRVVPLKARGKQPLTKHGFKDATDDYLQISEWWEKFHDANIGVATGDGLLVIDVDPRNGGEETLAKLLAELGPLPTDMVVRTGGGGLHYYLRYTGPKFSKPSDWRGIDIKYDGGYVVAPGSIHETGNEYRLES